MIKLISKFKLFVNKITKEQLMFSLYISYLLTIIVCIYYIIIADSFEYKIIMSVFLGYTFMSLTKDIVVFYDKFFIEKINKICDYNFNFSLKERKKQKQIYLHNYEEIKDIILNFRFLSKNKTFKNI